MKRVAGIENFRVIAAILVIANHTAVLSSFSEEADYLFSYCLGRVAVPFFFMVSGYFVIYPWLKKEAGSGARLLRFLKKTLLLYGLSTLLYVPLLMYSHQLPEDFMDVIRMLFFDGTYYHLWYFAAVIVGVGVLFLLKRLPLPWIGVVTFALYSIGIGGDLWYGAITRIPLCKSFYDFLFSIFTYTRNGLFFAPFFLWFGAWMHTQRKPFSLGLPVSMLLLVIEGLFTRHMGYQRFNAMYFALVLVMYGLFLFLQQWKGKQLKHAEELSLIVYILHPLLILFLRLMAKVAPAMKMVVENSLLLFALTVILSFCSAVFVVSMRSLYERKKKSLVHHF